MFGTLILGLVAGVVAPYAEASVKSGLEAATMAETPLSAAELRGLALAICLLVAAILAAVLFSAGAVSLMLGAVFGVFGPRVIARIWPRND